MKYKKCLSAIMVALFTVASFAPAAHAGWGIPIPLPIINKGTGADDNVFQQLVTLKNQYENLRQQLNILQDRLIYSIRSGDKLALLNTVEEMLSLQGQTEKFIWEEGKWKEQYKSYDELSAMALEDSYDQARKQVNRTNQAIYDAIRAQGFVISVQKDRMKLVEEILDQSDEKDDKAIGPVRLAQLGNHLAALQIEQLMRLEYLMATSMRMQALIYAQQLQALQKSDISVNLDQFGSFPTENPLEDGAGDYAEMLSEE